LSLTHDRGDFVAALWVSSRYLHTSLLSSALPYSRVINKTPPLAPHAAFSNYHFYIYNQLFFSLRLGCREFSFLLFNCHLIRVTRVLFSCSSLVPIVSIVSLKAQRSFHIYHIRKNTPPNPPTHIPPEPAVTYYDTYPMPSRLVSTLHSHRIVSHLASYTYRRRLHHPFIIILICSVTSIQAYVHTYDIRTADSSFFFSWPCCEVAVHSMH